MSGVTEGRMERRGGEGERDVAFVWDWLRSRSSRAPSRSRCGRQAGWSSTGRSRASAIEAENSARVNYTGADSFMLSELL